MPCYRVKQNHLSTPDTQPPTGANWSTYWEECPCCNSSAPPLNLYSVNDCTTGAMSIIDDRLGYNPSLNDTVMWFDLNGVTRCGQIVQVNVTSGTSTGFIGPTYSGGCNDCTVNFYYYDMEDCSDGTTFVGQSNSNSLNVGDVCAVYDPTSIGGYLCARVTATGASYSSSALGWLSFIYSDCCTCMKTHKVCRGATGWLGFTTPTSSSETYASGNFEHVVTTQISPSPGVPSLYVIDENTKVTVEADLGGRSAVPVVLSDFGTVTSTYPSGGQATIYHPYDDSANQCFTAATEQLRWRLKVECGIWNGSAITSCSITYTNWETKQISHANAGEQCSGSSCHVPSDFSMSLSGGSYAAGGYHNAVQVSASGSLSGVNSETKLTLETKLGGRAATDVVLSDFGQTTGLSISSGSISFAYDGSGCFNSATENLEYRLKVECGDNSSGSWVVVSTTYTAWSTFQVDHATNNEQCSGGGGGSNNVYFAFPCSGNGWDGYSSSCQTWSSLGTGVPIDVASSNDSSGSFSCTQTNNSTLNFKIAKVSGVSSLGTGTNDCCLLIIPSSTYTGSTYTASSVVGAWVTCTDCESSP